MSISDKLLEIEERLANDLLQVKDKIKQNNFYIKLDLQLNRRMNIIYLKQKSKWVSCLQLDFLSNSLVEYIYNPIEYARETHQMYLRLYADSAPKKIVFLGMNPGPFGNFGFLVCPSFRPSICSPVCLYAYLSISLKSDEGQSLNFSRYCICFNFFCVIFAF